MSIQRTVSSTSTLTNLSEDFAKEDLEDVDNVNLATKDLVRKAKSYIESLSNFDVIVMETIKVAPILRAMIDHAPCDRGRRYAACVIIRCDDNKPQLVNVANDWLKFLLLPCKSCISLADATITSTQFSRARIQKCDPSPLGLFYSNFWRHGAKYDDCFEKQDQFISKVGKGSN